MRIFVSTAAIFTAIALLPGFALALTGELVIEGTGDSQGMLRDLGWRFSKIDPRVEIIVPESVGNTGGIRALTNKEAELARISRPLTGEEREAGLTQVTFATSPVVFVVHPSVTEVDGITSEQAAGIYSGRITWWEELGGNRFKIYPVQREAGDSSRSVLEEKIPGLGGIEPGPMVKTAYSVNEATKIIRGHKNTIGYMPMSAAYRSGLKVLKVDGVYPSPENVSSGSYPYSVPLSVVRRADLSALGRAFVDFLFRQGAQKVITRYGGVQEKE
jgi:phosphate transport system substrate-binding protein